uniref:C-type lectin domain-containing protein n=1 Tax=Astyanax mexicanus TaxID=7994 RepID=A0A8B9KXD1_ASTMX
PPTISLVLHTVLHLGRCMILTNGHQSNWRDAETYCRQYYTNLATIHSDQEQQDVRDLLTDSDIVWIGLGFDNWLWSDGSKTTFRYWHPGQPYSATDDGNCAMVSTSWGGDWDDTACNGVMSFMCYKEPLLYRGCFANCQ